jgi:streptogramin lyase
MDKKVLLGAVAIVCTGLAGFGVCLGQQTTGTFPGFTVDQAKFSTASARSVPWLTILCKFSDVPSEPMPPAHYETLLGSQFPGMDHYWREVSYGQINLAGSRVIGWVNLPRARSYYVFESPMSVGLSRLLQDATAVVSPYVNLAYFAGITVITNDLLDQDYMAYGVRTRISLNSGSREFGVCWMAWRNLHTVFGQKVDTTHYTIAHEMGHALGLPHSSGPYGDTYDNFWDVMSYWGSNIEIPMYGRQAIHTNAFHKLRLGWFRPEEIFDVSAGTQSTIVLERLALPGEGYKMVRIATNPSWSRYYSFEARRRAGYDTGLWGEGVNIYDIDVNRWRANANFTGEEWLPSVLVDADDNEYTGDQGAAWTPGEIFHDSPLGISMAVERATETGYQITVNNNRKFVPDFVSGSALTSTLLLLNPSSSRFSSGTVQLFTPDGDSRQMVLNGAAVAGESSFTLPPLGAVFYRTPGGNDLTCGSIELGSSAPVHAAAIFASSFGAAAVQAGGISSRRWILPVEQDHSTGIRSGLALSNPHQQATILQLSLHSPDGSSFGEPVPVEIPAKGQVRRFVDEFIGSVPDLFVGTLVLTSDMPFNALAIQTQASCYATLPAGPMDLTSRPVQRGSVTTEAGVPGRTGAEDGGADVATFTRPADVAEGPDGALYLADSGNHVVRRISPDGQVSTFAGLAGVPGDADGKREAARFRNLRSLLFDAMGNLWIADSGNHTIRRISPEGQVTTAAGQAGVSGCADGETAASLFNFPMGLSIDREASIYVADNRNNAIRKISGEGFVTTLAGKAGEAGYADGQGATALFNRPVDTAIDEDGNVYCTDSNNYVIRKIDREGNVTTLSGKAGVRGIVDGPASEALLVLPAGLCRISPTRFLFSDRHVIRQVDIHGTVTTVAGSPRLESGPAISGAGVQDGTGLAARFRLPSGLCLSAQGHIHIADQNNHTIRRMSVDDVQTSLYFPQFADGAGIGSVLTLVNPSVRETAQVVVQVRDNAGQDLTGLLDPAQTDQVRASIPPLGVARFATSGLGGLSIGWAHVRSDLPLQGNLIFRTARGLAAVHGSNLSNRLLAPADISQVDGIDTGLAICNPNPYSAICTLRARAENGNLVTASQATVHLPANGQVAKFPAEFFSAQSSLLSHFRGSLEIQCDAMVAAIAIQTHPAELVTLPVSPVIP